MDTSSLPAINPLSSSVELSKSTIENERELSTISSKYTTLSSSMAATNSNNATNVNHSKEDLCDLDNDKKIDMNNSEINNSYDIGKKLINNNNNNRNNDLVKSDNSGISGYLKCKKLWHKNQSNDEISSSTGEIVSSEKKMDNESIIESNNSEQRTTCVNGANKNNNGDNNNRSCNISSDANNVSDVLTCGSQSLSGDKSAITLNIPKCDKNEHSQTLVMENNIACNSNNGGNNNNNNQNNSNNYTRIGLTNDNKENNSLISVNDANFIKKQIRNTINESNKCDINDRLGEFKGGGVNINKEDSGGGSHNDKIESIQYNINKSETLSDCTYPCETTTRLICDNRLLHQQTPNSPNINDNNKTASKLSNNSNNNINNNNNNKTIDTEKSLSPESHSNTHDIVELYKTKNSTHCEESKVSSTPYPINSRKTDNNDIMVQPFPNSTLENLNNRADAYKKNTNQNFTSDTVIYENKNSNKNVEQLEYTTLQNKICDYKYSVDKFNESKVINESSKYQNMDISKKSPLSEHSSNPSTQYHTTSQSTPRDLPKKDLMYRKLSQEYNSYPQRPSNDYNPPSLDLTSRENVNTGTVASDGYMAAKQSLIKNRTSALYVNAPDFSKSLSSKSTSQPNSSDLSPLHMKPPDFSKVSEPLKPSHSSYSRNEQLRVANPDFSRQFIGSSSSSSTRSNPPAEYVSQANFAEISRKYNYISDLQLKPPVTTKSSTSITTLSQSAPGYKYHKNLYVRTPDFSAHHLNNKLDSMSSTTKDKMSPTMNDEPQAHIIHKSQFQQQFRESRDPKERLAMPHVSYNDEANNKPTTPLAARDSSYNYKHSKFHYLSNSSQQPEKTMNDKTENINFRPNTTSSNERNLVDLSNRKYTEDAYNSQQMPDMPQNTLQQGSKYYTGQYRSSREPERYRDVPSNNDNNMRSEFKTSPAVSTIDLTAPTMESSSVIQSRMSDARYSYATRPESDQLNPKIENPQLSNRSSVGSDYNPSYYANSYYGQQGSPSPSQTSLAMYSKQMTAQVPSPVQRSRSQGPIPSPSLVSSASAMAAPTQRPIKSPLSNQKPVPNSTSPNSNYSNTNNNNLGMMNPPVSWPSQMASPSPTNNNFLQPSPRPSPSPTHVSSRSPRQSPVIQGSSTYLNSKNSSSPTISTGIGVLQKPTSYMSPDTLSSETASNIRGVIPKTNHKYQELPVQPNKDMNVQHHYSPYSKSTVPLPVTQQDAPIKYLSSSSGSAPNSKENMAYQQYHQRQQAGPHIQSQLLSQQQQHSMQQHQIQQHQHMQQQQQYQTHQQRLQQEQINQQQAISQQRYRTKINPITPETTKTIEYVDLTKNIRTDTPDYVKFSEFSNDSMEQNRPGLENAAKWSSQSVNFHDKGPHAKSPIDQQRAAYNHSSMRHSSSEADLNQYIKARNTPTENLRRSEVDLRSLPYQDDGRQPTNQYDNQNDKRFLSYAVPTASLEKAPSSNKQYSGSSYNVKYPGPQESDGSKLSRYVPPNSNNQIPVNSVNRNSRNYVPQEQLEMSAHMTTAAESRENVIYIPKGDERRFVKSSSSSNLHQMERPQISQNVERITDRSRPSETHPISTPPQTYKQESRQLHSVKQVNSQLSDKVEIQHIYAQPSKDYVTPVNTNQSVITPTQQPASIFTNVKRESPLDLSVKTVKTKADSTGCDDSSVSGFPRASNSKLNSDYARTGALKVDFSPNFSRPPQTVDYRKSHKGPVLLGGENNVFNYPPHNNLSPSTSKMTTRPPEFPESQNSSKLLKSLPTSKVYDKKLERNMKLSQDNQRLRDENRNKDDKMLYNQNQSAGGYSANNLNYQLKYEPHQKNDRIIPAKMNEEYNKTTPNKSNQPHHNGVYLTKSDQRIKTTPSAAYSTIKPESKPVGQQTNTSAYYMQHSTDNSKRIDNQYYPNTSQNTHLSAKDPFCHYEKVHVSATSITPSSPRKRATGNLSDYAPGLEHYPTPVKQSKYETKTVTELYEKYKQNTSAAEGLKLNINNDLKQNKTNHFPNTPLPSKDYYPHGYPAIQHPTNRSFPLSANERDVNYSSQYHHHPAPPQVDYSNNHHSTTNVTQPLLKKEHDMPSHHSQQINDSKFYKHQSRLEQNLPNHVKYSQSSIKSSRPNDILNSSHYNPNERASHYFPNYMPNDLEYTTTNHSAPNQPSEQSITMNNYEYYNHSSADGVHIKKENIQYPMQHLPPLEDKSIINAQIKLEQEIQNTNSVIELAKLNTSNVIQPVGGLIPRGVDQSVISKLRNSLEMKEMEKQQKLLIRSGKQSSLELSEDENKTDIASILAARIRTKGELKGFTPVSTVQSVNVDEDVPTVNPNFPAKSETFQPAHNEPPNELTDRASAFDLMDWGSTCNDFVEQLQTGNGKKRGRRKRYPKTAKSELVNREHSEKDDEIVKSGENDMKSDLNDNEGSSSDEDKPLLLLRQQSLSDGTKVKDGDSNSNSNSINMFVNKQERTLQGKNEKQEDKKNNSVSDNDKVNNNNRNIVVEKLTEKLVRNMREKHRKKLETRIASRLGESSSSESETEFNQKSLQNRIKKRIRKPKTRINVNSELNSSSDESAKHRPADDSDKLKTNKNELANKRKKKEKTSSDSESIVIAKKKLATQQLPNLNDIKKEVNDGDDNDKEKHKRSNIKKSLITEKIDDDKSSNDEDEEQDDEEEEDDDAEEEEDEDEDDEDDNQDDDDDEDNDDASEKKKSNKKKNIIKSEKTSSSSSESTDNEKLTRSISKTKIEKLSDGKIARRKHKMGTRRRKSHSDTKQSTETMTRSKKRRELEQQLANSKVLRNEKIVQNINRSDAKRKLDSKLSKNGSKSQLARSRGRDGVTCGRITLKTDESKRKILDSDSEEQISSKSKRKLRRVSKLLSSSNSSGTSTSSSNSESSSESDENVTDRLRSRKQTNDNLFRGGRGNKIADENQKSAEKKNTRTKDIIPKQAVNEETKNENLNKETGSQESLASNQTTQYPPGWEEDLYNYKRSLKIPPSLIKIGGRATWHRISTSLPDLDPHSSDASESFSAEHSKRRRATTKTPNSIKINHNLTRNRSIDCNSLRSESGDRIMYSGTEGEDSCSRLSGSTKSKLLNEIKTEDNASTVDSENSKSTSIIDLLHQRVIRLPTRTNRKSRSIVRLSNESRLLPRGTNEAELLPSLVDNSEENSEKNTFETTVLKSRTRTEYRKMKNKEIIREIFGGEDRPASAPPLGGENGINIIRVPPKDTNKNPITYETKYAQYLQKINVDFEGRIRKLNKLENSPLIDNNVIVSIKQEPDDINQEVEKSSVNTSPTIDDQEEETQDTMASYNEIDRDTPSFASERDGGVTPLSFQSVMGVRSNSSARKGRGNRSGRRKGSSGFDYIRKKKKPTIPTNDASGNLPPVQKRRSAAVNYLEDKDENDISREVKGWVLNKGVGESALHKASRLGYVDVIAYCLDRLDMPPDQKDNAGYTPLHEACSRGHLDIARLLLQYGANHSETALSGIRPLHEATENNDIEIVRLLLSYGADPLLATYSGQTPLMLAEHDKMIKFLKNYLLDVQNTNPNIRNSWKFEGPHKIYDPDTCGCNDFADIQNVIRDCDSSTDMIKSVNHSIIKANDIINDCERDDNIQTTITPIKRIKNEKISRENCDTNLTTVAYEKKRILKNLKTNKKRTPTAEEQPHDDTNIIHHILNEKNPITLTKCGGKFRSTNCTSVLNNGKPVTPPRPIRKGSNDVVESVNVVKKLRNSVDENNVYSQTQTEQQNISLDEVDSTSNEEIFDFEFEESENPLPPVYMLRDEGQEKWVLLTDLCNFINVKSKETLLKQICPSSPPATANKELLRELKTSEFLEKSICLQLLCSGEKINIRGSKVILVKYNESVRNLLGVKSGIMKL